MFKKFKQQYKRFMTGKSGFSLVELIVVIAIMAVMAAVLAPALLGYVERSRAQKDTSAMSEVVNSVQLSLADQDVYDEMLMYSTEQYSCYVDSDSPDEANKVDIKTGKYFMYNDNERQLDETVYRLDGVMRGVTITFAPDAAASNSATLDLVKGHVNKYLPSGAKTYGGLTGTNASPQLSAIVDSELYNSLRATIGDKIAISSQTYRNSEYTIFIAMGTTGGNQADMQDAIKVWGQWSGTNLPEGTSVATNGAASGTNAGSNEFQGTTGTPSAPAELTTVSVMNWSGFVNFDGQNIWTDGTNVYWSYEQKYASPQHFKLNNTTWEAQEPIGYMSGSDVWTDGTNIYCANGSTRYKLNNNGYWESNAAGGGTYIYGSGIWTDGTNYYYSLGGSFENKFNGNSWSSHMPSWYGLDIDGSRVWTDGTNVYHSNGTAQHVFKDNTWKTHTWEGLTAFDGSNVWTDGKDIYYSSGTNQYVLRDGKWEVKTWSGINNFNGKNVWTDGTNYYYSDYTNHYIFS